MKITAMEIADVFLIEPKRFGDSRGYFSETFRSDVFESAAGPISFVQDNQSLSVEKGTIRGLHFQRSPRAQAKLVRVVQGAIYDVAVDIRKGSKTFGHYVGAELSAENNLQLYIPKGFLHGFCTLTPNTIITYKVSDYYSPELDAGIIWNDPDISIVWPVTDAEAILSDKDRQAPVLSAIEPFT